MGPCEVRRVEGRKRGEVFYQAFIGSKPMSDARKTEAEAQADADYYNSKQERPAEPKSP